VSPAMHMWRVQCFMFNAEWSGVVATVTVLCGAAVWCCCVVLLCGAVVWCCCLQVSDREYLSIYPSWGDKVPLAQELVQQGRGSEVVFRQVADSSAA